MNTARKVALYGNSLVVSSIGESLKESPRFEVKQIEGFLCDDSPESNTAWPDVILFDLSSAPDDLTISLLRKHPTVILIGVDLAGNKMLVLSGEHCRPLTADDLFKVIEGDDVLNEFIQAK